MENGASARPKYCWYMKTHEQSGCRHYSGALQRATRPPRAPAKSAVGRGARRSSFLAGSLAYHLAKSDELVILAAVHPLLRQQQAGRLASRVFHVPSRDKSTGMQQHARLARLLAAVADQHAGFGAAAADAELQQFRRSCDGLD